MPSRPSTVGSASFDPDRFFERWASGDISAPKDNDLRSAIITAFDLKSDDDYVYHATASVTLAQVQAAINYGDRGGLLAWYTDAEGKPVRFLFLCLSHTTNTTKSSPTHPAPTSPPTHRYSSHQHPRRAC